MIGLEDIAGIKSAEEGKAVALAIYNLLEGVRAGDLCIDCMKDVMDDCECDDEADYAVEEDDDDE